MCPIEGDNSWKRLLIPHTPSSHKGSRESFFAMGSGYTVSACWWGNGSPRLWRLSGLRGWSDTLELRHGPDSYGRQQWGILRNGGNPDAATPCGGWSPSGRKAMSGGTILTVPPKEGPANYVQAAAVIRRVQALLGITGRKARAGGLLSWMWNPMAQP